MSTCPKCGKVTPNKLTAFALHLTINLLSLKYL